MTEETGLKLFNFEIVRVDAKGEQIKKESKQSQYFSQDLGSDITLEMVAIPGGTFLMGTEDEEIERLIKKFNWDEFRIERPQHKVTIQPFFMGKYPITQAQWQAIASRTDLKVKQDLDLNPAYFKDPPKPPLKRGFPIPPLFKGGARGGSPTRWDRPVEQVNWYDVIEFCARLSKLTVREYRLPSEAEWEYACRAGTTTPFYFGETITGELANYKASYTYADEPKGEYRSETTPVGQFPPNAFGLYDMHGNVWELCADSWHDNYDDAPTDGSAWIKNGNDNRSPLRRGGSWSLYPRYCRSALRVRDFPVNRDFNKGFRVVCRFPRTGFPSILFSFSLFWRFFGATVVQLYSLGVILTQELSVISWEGGVILWVVKLLKKPARTMSALVKPSGLIPKGLRVQQINNLTLFKFTDELGDRMQTLLDKKKADDLTPEEVLELEAIGELDQIFSYINAVIAARVNGHS